MDDQDEKPTHAPDDKWLRIVPKTHVQIQAEEAELRRQLKDKAWDMRVGGASTGQIAKELKVSQQTISNWLRATARERDQEGKLLATKAGAKAMAVARAEQILLGLMPGILDPRTPHADKSKLSKSALSAIDMLNRIHGTYAPTKIASTTPDGEQWAPTTLMLSKLSTEDLQALKRANDLMLLGDGDEIIDAEPIEKTGTDDDQ